MNPLSPAVQALECEYDVILETYTMPTKGRPELVTLVAEGRYGRQRNVVRPMIQIIDDLPDPTRPVENHWGKATGYQGNPCAACLDFSRSWNCPDHTDTGKEGS